MIDRPLFQRIREIVPTLDVVTQQLEREQAATARHHRLLLVILAGLVDLAEHISQSTMDIGDLADATGDLHISQTYHLKQLNQLSNMSNDARTKLYNLLTMIVQDPFALAELLKLVKPEMITDAARILESEKVGQLIAALESGRRRD